MPAVMSYFPLSWPLVASALLHDGLDRDVQALGGEQSLVLRDVQAGLVRDGHGTDRQVRLLQVLHLRQGVARAAAIQRRPGSTARQSSRGQRAEVFVSFFPLTPIEEGVDARREAIWIPEGGHGPGADCHYPA